MTIDERLATTLFPLPAIREVNLAKHPTSIGLGLGELRDFKTDEKIAKALQKGLVKDGFNYTANAGLLALRHAVAKKQMQCDGFNYIADNVVIGIGVQNALYATIKTLAKLGARRVLIPEINFAIYKKIPLEFGLQVETYALTGNFGINLAELEKQLLPDDLVIINSPANPTGRVLSENEQTELGNLFSQKLTRGFVLSDEIYSQLIYDGPKAISFSKFFDRTLVFDGISKSGACAGLRVGWVITRDTRLANAIISENAGIISCPPTPNQYAAIPVVEGETYNTIDNYNKILKANRDTAIRILTENKIPFEKPTGSFYMFARIAHLINREVKTFCIETAKKENGVVVIPGIAFGAPDYIRISLATDQIHEGMKRLIDAIKSNL
jgi:aspartate aminotransferase